VVHVASGTSGGVPWSVDVAIGAYDRCFSSKVGTQNISECPDFGARVDTTHIPGSPTTFVLGEVDAKTVRVDVVFKDGGVQQLTPVRSNGHSFVATYVPPDRTVASVTPVTGPNK
jgi:hypothetical protein